MKKINKIIQKVECFDAYIKTILGFISENDLLTFNKNTLISDENKTYVKKYVCIDILNMELKDIKCIKKDMEMYFNSENLDNDALCLYSDKMYINYDISVSQQNIYLNIKWGDFEK